MKICFAFITQAHQTFHALPIALELARRHPDAEVHLAAATAGQLATLRALAEAYAPGAPVIFDQLRVPPLFGWRDKAGVPPKTPTLLYNAPYFARFDALVVPERTSLVLKQLLRKTKIIWTGHGAGDRAIGFAKDIKDFDFVLLAGAKIEQRMLERKLIRPGDYATGIYAKFDLVERLPRAPLFANGRPTILYNPHFRLDLSSWRVWGRRVLEFFAASDRYNLILAPHVRLFDPPTPAKYATLMRYADCPNIRIDLGSMASSDMTYTIGSDLYLGDVSSQVAEFLRQPRPCVFLNAHHVAWEGDPNYRFWELGPVVDDINDLESAIDLALASPDAFRLQQRAYVEETFGAIEGPTAPKGADAIVAYLRREGAGR